MFSKALMAEGKKVLQVPTEKTTLGTGTVLLVSKKSSFTDLTKSDQKDFIKT